MMMSIEKSRSRLYRRIGVGISVIYLAAVGGYAVTKDISWISLDPNELGDFLAGVFGPLGILWLILGFWQQGDELRSSVRALELQTEELRQSVEQQKALVHITSRQTDAALQSLNESRQARQEASKPYFVLSTNGGSGGGAAPFITNLELRNLGASCAEVSIFDFDTEFPKMIHRIPSLRNGESSRFDLTCSGNDHIGFELCIKFRDGAGEIDEVRFYLSRANEISMGFMIERK